MRNRSHFVLIFARPFEHLRSPRCVSRFSCNRFVGAYAEPAGCRQRHAHRSRRHSAAALAAAARSSDATDPVLLESVSDVVRGAPSGVRIRVAVLARTRPGAHTAGPWRPRTPAARHRLAARADTRAAHRDLCTRCTERGASTSTSASASASADADADADAEPNSRRHYCQCDLRASACSGARAALRAGAHAGAARAPSGPVHADGRGGFAGARCAHTHLTS